MPWNPLNPELAPDPYPLYAQLREQDPVYFEKAFGWYFVTGHEEGQRVLREPGGEMCFDEFQRMRMGRDVSAEPYHKGLRNFLPAIGPDDDHKRIRGTFQRHFTPRRVAALRDATVNVAHSLIGEL